MCRENALCADWALCELVDGGGRDKGRDREAAEDGNRG